MCVCRWVTKWRPGQDLSAGGSSSAVSLCRPLFPYLSCVAVCVQANSQSHRIRKLSVSRALHSVGAMVCVCDGWVVQVHQIVTNTLSLVDIAECDASCSDS